MSILVSNSLARGLRRERAVDTRTADRQWLHWAWLPVVAGLGLSLLGIAAIGTTEHNSGVGCGVGHGFSLQ